MDLNFLVRLLLAAILGGIIGFEREKQERPAGLRTNILVCVGAALVMLTNEFILKESGGGQNIDPTRMGAQVITGVGFLGAGTILRQGFNVKGLTTAASLWAVACIGLAVGTGYIYGAVAGTLIIYITLRGLKIIDEKLEKKCKN